MLRIEVSTVNGSSYDRAMFEKKLRLGVLHLVSELAQGRSLDVARVQFIKPKR